VVQREYSWFVDLDNLLMNIIKHKNVGYNQQVLAYSSPIHRFRSLRTVFVRKIIFLRQHKKSVKKTIIHYKNTNVWRELSDLTCTGNIRTFFNNTAKRLLKSFVKIFLFRNRQTKQTISTFSVYALFLRVGFFQT